MNCRHCGEPLQHKFLDLGASPASNAYLTDAQLNLPEPYFPLKVFVCEHCWLVQTEDFQQADALFTDDYAYFSSVSASWLAHAKAYFNSISERLGLSADSFVVEIASNDGYLLRNFVSAEIPCLGVEPTECTAKAAEAQGVPTLKAFFSRGLSEELVATHGKADLIVGNNVFAHVPMLNDFTEGLKTLLSPQGTITLEFPHLMRLVASNQFDTVYHEHFSYLSLTAVSSVFKQAGLRIYDVEELPTHGGSLRIYGCHEGSDLLSRDKVALLMRQENHAGMGELGFYQGFQTRAESVKDALLSFLIDAKKQGKKVVAYGAAAKGNTLLNFAGVKPDLVSCVYDAAPSKQGKYLPGSRVKIKSPDALPQDKPDYILLLPWNIKNELIDQIKSKGVDATFIVAIPELEFL